MLNLLSSESNLDSEAFGWSHLSLTSENAIRRKGLIALQEHDFISISNKILGFNPNTSVSTSGFLRRLTTFSTLVYFFSLSDEGFDEQS